MARVLADFEGTWLIDRRIVQRSGPRGRFAGTAQWAPDADGMRYSEVGELEIEGQPPMHAERKYRWGRDLTVFFPDGTFFHQVPALGGLARHWCAPDMYSVRYRFARWPEFETVWRVTGPRKDYAMVTRYKRA